MDPATIAALRDFGYPAVMSFALLFMFGKNLEKILKLLTDIHEQLVIVLKNQENIMNEQERQTDKQDTQQRRRNG
jgi:hypothetical protein